MKKISDHFINKRFLILSFFALTFILVSCKKFLDAKTDKQLVIPESLNDAQALLDFYTSMNGFYPCIGDESDDDFYLLDSYFNSQNIIRRDHYIWAKEALDETDWANMYGIVLNANIAIETVDKQTVEIRNSVSAKNIKGAALFYRAFAFYHIVQYYAAPYDKSIATTTPGIPLRLTSDASPVSKRSTLEESWQQIVNDLKSSVQLLPVSGILLSRPSKGASYAALARIFLDMGEFEMSGKYADSSLQLYNTLLDYNAINGSPIYPFKRFNSEVFFSSVIPIIGPLAPANYKVDSLLYQSYDSNDLRRKLYFISNGPGTVGFRGSYDGTNSLFNGFATDEQYFIRAECAARAGLKDSAMADLNRVLLTRWITGTFVPFAASNADDALDIVLRERRKELIMRGSRWFDLRRLNKEPRFAKTLNRELNGTTYTLSPNDLRYTFPIPVQVIALTGMQQNPR